MALHLLAGAAILRVVFPRANAARRRALVGWWSAKLLRIVDVTPRVAGEPPAEGEAAAMIAANHVSWVDIFAISSIRPTRFIAKSEIRDWPLAGWVVERAGTIFIRRERRRDTARISDLVHAALAQGDRVGLVALRARGGQPGARASLRDPLRASRRLALPRDGLRGRALVHAIPGTRDPPARHRGPRGLRRAHRHRGARAARGGRARRGGRG
jgi:1-acyl-sn-glycerol-3-phosphate acyltransferase